ncbi:MAG: hypothetical protein HYS13_12225 [Planctomycetia bacterium]|nr:hypothetical protein [Planctomycetia bacterium]
MRLTLPKTSCPVACLFFGWMGVLAALADAPASPAVETLLAAVLVDLDSPKFDVREVASKRLAELAQRPDANDVLAPVLYDALARADLSLEVRARLEPIAEKFSPPELATEALPGEVDTVVALLADGNSRHSAAGHARLARLSKHAQAIRAVQAELKRHLARPELPAEVREALQTAHARLRERLIDSGDAAEPDFDVSAGQIAAWIDEVSRGASPDDPMARCIAVESAFRELEDALLCDRLAPKISEALGRRLETGVADPDAAERLERLHEWSRPGLVAESWSKGELVTLQLLVIGLPQRPVGAPRITLFDRADDKTAHCASGNSLVPGTYPIGQAIPHPELYGSFFHLINTPTPRRKARYELTHRRWTMAGRRLRLTEQTVRGWTAVKRHPTDVEIDLLFDELDGAAVSKAIGEYLAAVDDRDDDEVSYLGFPSGASRHARVAFKLIRHGTHEALPGLVQSLDAGKFRPPTAKGNQYHYGWMAVLGICRRDPWPGVDDFLAGLLHRRERLFVPANDGQDEVPEVGATAAAILAERNGWKTADLGLERMQFDPLNNAGCPGHRFASPAASERVLAMWGPDEIDE